MEKNSNLLTIVKKAAISALLGHAVSILILLFVSTALSKNEDPFSLMSAGALVALFVGAFVCGAFAGKTVDVPLGGAISGGMYIIMLIVASLIADAFLKEEDGGYTLGIKLAIILIVMLISLMTGLFVNIRKSSHAHLSRRRKMSNR